MENEIHTILVVVEIEAELGKKRVKNSVFTISVSWRKLAAPNMTKKNNMTFTNIEIVKKLLELSNYISAMYVVLYSPTMSPD